MKKKQKNENHSRRDIDRKKKRSPSRSTPAFYSQETMADDYGYPSYGRGNAGKSYEPFR